MIIHRDNIYLMRSNTDLILRNDRLHKFNVFQNPLQLYYYNYHYFRVIFFSVKKIFIFKNIFEMKYQLHSRKTSYVFYSKNQLVIIYNIHTLLMVFNAKFVWNASYFIFGNTFSNNIVKWLSLGNRFEYFKYELIGFRIVSKISHVTKQNSIIIIELIMSTEH